ncbi:MAG: hypothetical protein PCFJNLEI_04148 [Verrucomicrobiae bacterium]|nr:hypothetical protein [Verrucomicrobiae bacterium]
MMDATSPENVTEIPVSMSVIVLLAPLSNTILFRVLIVVFVATNRVAVFVPNCSTSVSEPVNGAELFVQLPFALQTPFEKPQAYSVVTAPRPEYVKYMLGPASVTAQPVAPKLLLTVKFAALNPNCVPNDAIKS